MYSCSQILRVHQAITIVWYQYVYILQFLLFDLCRSIMEAKKDARNFFFFFENKLCFNNHIHIKLCIDMHMSVLWVLMSDLQIDLHNWCHQRNPKLRSEYFMENKYNLLNQHALKPLAGKKYVYILPSFIFVLQGLLMDA